MDQQWQLYSDMAGNRQARYPTTQQQQPQQSNGSAPQHQQQHSYGYEAYQNPSVPSQSQSMAVSPIGTPQTRSYASGDGDVAMEDADPYNRMKYPARPSHHHRPSGQHLGQEDSSAARRYSPMKATPSSPYAPSSQQPSQSPYGHYPSQSTSARQSPTRSSHYSTPSQSNYATPSKSAHNYVWASRIQTWLLIQIQPQLRDNHHFISLLSNLVTQALTSTTRTLQQPISTPFSAGRRSLRVTHDRFILLAQQTCLEVQSPSSRRSTRRMIFSPE